MTWKDRTQPAKFGGVVLQVEYTAWTRGRRVPVRELVGQDVSVQQDLGRSPDTIEITAFFWGDSFDTQRDALESVLLKEGAQILTLPTRGDLNVRVISGPFTNEERAAQGYCTIRFTVVVEPRTGSSAAASAGGLKAKTDTVAKLTKAADAVKPPATSKLDSILAKGMPSSALKSTVGAITDVTTAAKQVQRVIQANLNVIQDVSAAINDLGTTANIILQTPSALATKITAVVLGVMELANIATTSVDRTTGLVTGGALTPFESAATARATLSALKILAPLGSTATTSTGVNIGKGTVPPASVSRVGGGASVGSPARASSSSSSTTSGGSGASGGSSGSSSSAATFAATSAAALRASAPTTLSVSDQEQVNTRAVYEATRALAIATAASIFATVTFDSSTLALGALEALNTAIDDLQEYCSSDDLFDVLAELRGAAAEHLVAVASELPAAASVNTSGLVTITSTSKTATLVVGQSASPIDGTSSRTGSAVSTGLPRVVQYAPPREVPAVLIAHTIYGNAELETDIIARNNVSHPLFVSGAIEMIEP